MNKPIADITKEDLLASINFDLEALRAKYIEERDKRLNDKKNDQYVEVKGDFKHYVDDPYADPNFSRAPIIDTVEVFIIGGGYGGLIAGARLAEAGITDFRIIEKGGDFGGTWYWNRYPGAQCDIDAYIYMPLLEETGYIPTRKYAYSPEIREQAKRIGTQFNLYDGAMFQTAVSDVRWDETEKMWTIKTDRDDVIKARYIINCGGPLDRPKLPGIPGIDTFKGHTFHTSRWDYGYTGGDHTGGMTGLADKRVAVIGTGATAIQCVPYVGQSAKHLYVFQRTPSTVDYRNNRPTDPEWAASLKPGWQKERMENFTILTNGGFADQDLVHDGWTDTIRNVGRGALTARGLDKLPPDLAALALEIADHEKTNEIRQRIDETVTDPDTAEKLKTWYRLFCKRPTFNDEYLPTFNRPNVTLVDTDGKGVERITENALVVDGVEYPVDCIIFATGFEVGTGYTRRSGFEITGRGGRKFSDHYANGQRTLHGYYSHGFPNFFHFGISQNAFKANFTHILEEQAEHTVRLLTHMKAAGKTVVEPTAEAEEMWVQVIKDKAKIARAFLAQCTPGYYSGEGDLDKGLLIETYGAGPLEYGAVMNAWWDDGKLEGLTLE